MKLENIYEKDISRHIDPAVVVGNMDKEQIKQEIEEYVFTKDILQNIYKFLDAIVNKTTGKTGVWINGYYGSGKSHFIKYLFYCLNQDTRQVALQRYIEAVRESKELDDFSEVTSSNVSNIEKKINALTIDEIIFNIDAVAGIGNSQSVITRVLLKQLNAKRGFNSQNIALARLVEKQLYKLGQLEAFKERIFKVFDTPWEDNNIKTLLHLRKAQVIDVVAEFDKNIDKDSLAEALKDEQEYTIEELIFELKEYIEEKPENYRLIFLMDEVSQYIGTNSSLLLNLQTIVEEVGSKLGQKVWIVCTAQQDLSSLVNSNDGKKEGFGKIMGRFETMISLDSQDTKYITQKRLLEKNTEGSKALVDFYQENKGGIENQFELEHNLYQNFQNAEEFYLSYPFVPYQFRLISDVFQSFSAIGFVGEGVKNTERAILGITHFTAKDQKDKELGYFISFDNFYNDQLSKNLTHFAKSALDRAFNIDFDEDIRGFAHRVIKVLFMISHLDDSLKINFPATIENLSLLLINHVSEVKMDIQKRVETVLNKLINSNIIQESEGKYRFLNNDGILVANTIANTNVNSTAQLKYFYDQFIKSLLKPQPTYNLGNKNIKISISIDDKEETTGGDFKVKFVVFTGVDTHQEAMNIPSTEMDVNISEWFYKNEDFRNGFNKYAKTAKFLEENRAGATGERVKTIEEFAQDNTKLLTELQAKFVKNFATTSYTSQNRVFDGNSILSTVPAQKYAQMLENHAKAIYQKHEWSSQYAKNNEELKTAIAQNIGLMDNGLNLAEEEVNNAISNYGNMVSLTNLVKHFDKAPYGWKDIAVLHIVYNIVKKKHRALYYLNEEMELGQYFDLAINASSRAGIEVRSPKDYNQDEINDFCAAVQDIFIGLNISSNMEVKEIVDSFHKDLGEILKQVNSYKNDYEGYPFTENIRAYHTVLANIKEIRNSDKLMQSIIAQKNTLKQQRDEFAQIKDFIDNNIDRYNEIKEFLNKNKTNLEKLEEIEDANYAEQYREIKNFMMTERNPALQFPVVLKQYKTLKKAIEDSVEKLRGEVAEFYNKIFDDLELKLKENNLAEKNIIPERSAVLGKIQGMDSINTLEIEQYKGSDFKVDNLKRIEEEISRKTGNGEHRPAIASVNITSNIAGKTLSTAEDVDKLLGELRNKLMLELGKSNSKIILK